MSNGNAKAHIISAIALAAMLTLAAGSGKSTPAEAEADLAAAANERAILDDYVGKMGAVYTRLAALDVSKLDDTRCDQAAMLKNAPPKESYGSLPMPRVFGPFLHRFASKAPSDWTAYTGRGEWDWINGTNYGGHFEKAPAARNESEVSETARRVKEEFIPQRYAVIVWPTGAKNHMPAWDGATKTFTSGRFDGIMFVVDILDGSITCQAHLHVESASEVSYRTRGLFKENPESALEEDFEDSMKKKLTAALPEKVNLGPMGSLF